MDYEYLPSMLRAAALLLLIWIDSYFAQGASSIQSKALLQRSRQCFGFPISKYKYERYSAAERLFPAKFKDFSSKGIALSAGNGRDSTNNRKDSAS